MPVAQYPHEHRHSDNAHTSKVTGGAKALITFKESLALLLQKQ